MRFLLANTSDFDASKHALPLAEMSEIDRYAIAMTRAMARECVAAYGATSFTSSCSS